MTDEEIAISLTKHTDELKNLKHRVACCEEENETIREIALSVNKLAVNMEYMLREQKDQGVRLTALERAPADGFRSLKDAVIKCLTSSVLGALLGALMALILR